MIDDTNATINYNRHHTRDIQAAVRSLSPEQKQQLLDKIALHRGVCNLIDKDYNHQDCERIEKLLTKETKWIEGGRR